VFEKAVMICGHSCRNLKRIDIGERVAMGCVSPGANAACRELQALLRGKAVFALHVTDIAVLPHAKELKVQCGGLRGLQQALEPETEAEGKIADIATLVAEAQEHFAGLENLPFGEIMRSISHFEGRKRGKT
jgi:hypothetical protein